MTIKNINQDWHLFNQAILRKNTYTTEDVDDLLFGAFGSVHTFQIIRKLLHKNENEHNLLWSLLSAQVNAFEKLTEDSANAAEEDS